MLSLILLLLLPLVAVWLLVVLLGTVLGRFSAKEKAKDDWLASKSCSPSSRHPIESSYSIKLVTTRKAHSTAATTVAVPGSRSRKVKIGPHSVNFFRIPAVALEENAAASYRTRERSYKPSLGLVQEVELRIGVCASLPPPPVKPKRHDLSVTQRVQHQIIEHEHTNWACTTNDCERRFEPARHVSTTTITTLPPPPVKPKLRDLSVTQRVQLQIAEHEHTTWACTSDGFEAHVLLPAAADDDSSSFDVPLFEEDDDSLEAFFDDESEVPVDDESEVPVEVEPAVLTTTLRRRSSARLAERAAQAQKEGEEQLGLTTVNGRRCSLRVMHLRRGR